MCHNITEVFIFGKGLMESGSNVVGSTSVTSTQSVSPSDCLTQTLCLDPVASDVRSMPGQPQLLVPDAPSVSNVYTTLL